jgi:predicted restriction endonuclease
MDFFGYGMEDFVACEVCDGKTIDIHHINGRGKGKNVIENLMGLCREHHNMANTKSLTRKQLQELHNLVIKAHTLNQ